MLLIIYGQIIDRIRIPWLTKKWVTGVDGLHDAKFNLICLVCWSLTNPSINLALVISIGLIIAIASATQDIKGCFEN